VKWFIFSKQHWYIQQNRFIDLITISRFYWEYFRYSVLNKTRTELESGVGLLRHSLAFVHSHVQKTRNNSNNNSNNNIAAGPDVQPCLLYSRLVSLLPIAPVLCLLQYSWPQEHSSGSVNCDSVGTHDGSNRATDKTRRPLLLPEQVARRSVGYWVFCTAVSLGVTVRIQMPSSCFVL
jgi:hypothetical protein